jgi:hypothetical protein
MVDKGVIGRLYAPFGSENDGTVYQIGICDACVKEVKLVALGDYMDSDLDKEVKQAREVSQ